MKDDITNVRLLATTDGDLEVLGGKGRSLARMVNAGFSVPDGFHLTTAAYKAFVADNNLQAKIVELARPEVTAVRASFERASTAIQQLIGEYNLSAETIAELSEAYAALVDPSGGRAPAVAVRSSANAEDLPGLSFAGQQETYLNVSGAEALLAAVRNCWASLWTVQAISYRHEHAIDQGSVAMAVVVQIMVPADVAGILFTANPATGERSELIINASFGLGEAVVGGQVTPDTFIVDRNSMAVKETIIGPKEQKVISDAGQGTRLEDVSENERAQSSLSDALLGELASLAIKVEEHFDGLPQDIEWAIADGKLSLLQSRPITNLPPQPIEVQWEAPEGIKGLVRRQLIENVPDPTFPLFDELYIHKGLAGRKPGGRSGFTTLHGFAFQIAGFATQTNDEQFRREIKAQKEAATSSPEGRAQEQHDLQMFLDQLTEPERADFQTMADGLATDNLAHAVTMPESDNPTYVAFNKTAVNDRQHADWRERAVPELEAATEKWRRVDVETAPDEQLLTGIRELAAAEGWYWSSNGGHTFGVAKSTDDQLQCFLRETLPDHQFTSGQFLSGFKSRIMQANDDLYDICKMIRASKSLFETVVATPAKRLMGELQAHPDSGPILEALDSYLQIYGHQGYSLDFGEPTQIEDPSTLFVTLKAMVQNRDYHPKQHEEQATRKREQAMKDIEELLDGLQYWQFRYRLWFTRKYYPIREESCFVLGTAWPVLRPIATELGQRLVDIGTLATSEDIYFLNTSEIEPAMEARQGGNAIPEYAQLAAERRELREARRRLHPPGTIPPEISENPGVKFKETQFINDDSSGTLRGIPVSPGTITSQASVIHNADEFDQMRPGSILVCPMTSPAWTQLFAHASGLVTDIGGILGHGSIVAREYGIPAVVGTGNITRRVKNGQILEVDGDAGTVVIQSD